MGHRGVDPRRHHRVRPYLRPDAMGPCVRCVGAAGPQQAGVVGRPGALQVVHGWRSARSRKRGCTAARARVVLHGPAARGTEPHAANLARCLVHLAGHAQRDQPAVTVVRRPQDLAGDRLPRCRRRHRDLVGSVRRGARRARSKRPGDVRVRRRRAPLPTGLMAGRRQDVCERRCGLPLRHVAEGEEPPTYPSPAGS